MSCNDRPLLIFRELRLVEAVGRQFVSEPNRQQLTERARTCKSMPWLDGGRGGAGAATQFPAQALPRRGGAHNLNWCFRLASAA